MELIQNSVYNREGKKWKQRWASLKRVSPKSSSTSSHDTYLYVFLYKSQQHAVEDKKKLVLPLIDFCGAEVCKQYDKAKDVLVLITTSQTSFFSFESTQIRDQWMRILEDHFGKGVAYNINIPDKQKRKNGESMIRVYQTFFSITNKNFKCLNRWFTNDIRRFSAEGDSNFVFEIGSQNKSKGILVNVLVPENAEELLKQFEYITAEMEGPALSQRDFTGSSVLIDIEQSKRNAGDRNFVRRVLLRASDRLRKKHRERSRSTPTARKFLRESKSINDSISDEGKFRSLDRRKSPNIGVQVNDDIKEKTINILRTASSPRATSFAGFNRTISIDEPAPPVPKKKSPNSSSSSQQQLLEQKQETSTNKSGTERSLLRSKTLTNSDLAKNNMNEEKAQSEEKLSSKGSANNLKPNVNNGDDNDVGNVKWKMSMTPTDKSEIVKLQPRRSTDGVVNNNYKQPANPAQYAINKTKRCKDKKTPTPPPRSPVSLGLATQTTVFDFPPTEKTLNDCEDGKEEVEAKQRTMHSDSDDAFASTEPSPSHFDYSNIDYSAEPAYRNISQIRRDSSSSRESTHLSAVNQRPYRRSSKHLSDPLSLEAWSLATGDGKQVSSLQHLQHFNSDQLDYINLTSKMKATVKSDDSPNGSYVNVSTSESGKPEIGGQRKKAKKIPEPLKITRQPLRSYKNEFEKYDDEDSRIYHAVGVFDEGTSNSIITRKAGGSYENMSLKVGNNTSNVNHTSDYLNLMSPSTTTPIGRSKHMNYAILPDFNSKSVSTSPVRISTRSPIEKPNKSDYTLIDEVGTSALANARSKHEYNRQTKSQSSGNRTPTKNLK